MKMEITNACAICVEAKSGFLSDAFLSDMAGLKIARIISSENSTFTVPSLGGLGNTHLLVCTREHYPCLRDCTQATRDDVVSTVSRISKDLRQRSGGHTFIFENGSSFHNMSEPRCIDHTHVHIVHLDNRIPDPPMMNFHDFKSVSLTQVSQETVSPSNDYVVAGWDIHKMTILQSPHVQTQLIRRHIATETGVPAEWNWRDYPRVENVKHAMGIMNESVTRA